MIQARLLGDLAFFRDLPLHATLDLCQRVRVEKFAPSQVMYRQGALGDDSGAQKLYVVISGGVEMRQKGELGAGEGSAAAAGSVMGQSAAALRRRCVGRFLRPFPFWGISVAFFIRLPSCRRFFADR